MGYWIAGTGELGLVLVPGRRRLHQRRVLLLVMKGRRQWLLGWRHQMRN